MTIEVVVDSDLLAKARKYSGLQDNTEIVQLALTHLIQREAGRKLAKLGGTEPQLRPIPRRRLL